MFKKPLAAACLMITAVSASSITDEQPPYSFMVKPGKGKPFIVERKQDGIIKIETGMPKKPEAQKHISLTRDKPQPGESTRVEFDATLTPRSVKKALEQVGEVSDFPAGLPFNAASKLLSLMLEQQNTPHVTSYYENLRDVNGIETIYDVSREKAWLEGVKKDFPRLNTSALENWYRNKNNGSISGLGDYRLMEYVWRGQHNNPGSSTYQSLSKEEASAIEKALRARTDFPEGPFNFDHYERSHATYTNDVVTRTGQ